MKRLAFLVSGNGTNMENLIKEIRASRIPAEAALVISDEPLAKALERAAELGVPTAVVDRKKSVSKTDFEARIIKLIDDYRIDLIVLAGFMRILSPEFVKRYFGKIVNIHPALLPKFPGAHAIRDAYEAKVKETGVTVHFVDEGVDTGPIILQRKIRINPEETLESLERRIHEIEYETYPEALRRILSGHVQLTRD